MLSMPQLKEIWDDRETKNNTETVDNDVDEEDEPDECCQRCKKLFFPHEVIILDDLGPVCKDCCTVADVALAVSQGSLDTDGETPEEFLEQWRADEPV